MANLAKVLKDEISRIARREARPMFQELKKENIALKKTVSELRKRLDDLDKKQRKIVKVTGKEEKIETPAPQEGRFWITGKGVRSMRNKAQLTQVEFAELLGVSPQAVVNWESQDSKLNLRTATQEAFQKYRGIGAREARRILEETSES